MSLRIAISVLAALLMSGLVQARDIDCEGEYGDVELDGNLNVAAPCRLNGTVVDGNIKMFAGGSLTAVGAEIEGNINAKTADFIDL